MRDPQELHDWVASYNWDDGLAPIWPIVDSAQTEFATALMIYWRMDGPWVTELPSASAQEHHKLVCLVRDRLLAGFYAKGKLRFSPAEDEQVSRTMLYKLAKAGIAQELLKPKYDEQD